MKVALATGLYPPEIGGPATYALMLEAELPARGVEVVTVPFGWVRGYPKIIRHLVYAWKLWRASKSADIIYALDPISVGLPASVVARVRKLPFLVRLGGDYAWEQGRVRFGVTHTLDEYIEAMDQAPFAVRQLAKLQTYVVNRATKVIVPSKYLKSIVVCWGVEAERVQVIYSALYPLEVNEPRSALREKLGYQHPTIVSAARLVPWKGFPVLIRVIEDLRERYPHISLVIIGDGEERQKLEALVNAKHLSAHVRFIGRVGKDALGASLRAADVFVLNTAYEGLSHQLIEVMDIGVPIVTTTAGGNPELIKDGMQGYLVPFNDRERLNEAIRRVLDHPESRERMTQSARARSKDFQQEKVMQTLVEVLHSVYAKEPE